MPTVPDTVACPRCDGFGKLGGYYEREYDCSNCKGSGRLAVLVDWHKNIAVTEEDARIIRLLDYLAKQGGKDKRRRVIQQRRLLSLLQAYFDKPVPSVWARLRRPSV